MTTIGYLDRNGVGEEWYSEQETQLGRVLFVQVVLEGIVGNTVVKLTLNHVVYIQWNTTHLLAKINVVIRENTDGDRVDYTK